MYYTYTLARMGTYRLPNGVDLSVMHYIFLKTENKET